MIQKDDPPMEHLFILNPAAGKYDQTEEFTQKIRQVFDPAGLPYRILRSQKKGDCTRFAREAAAAGSPIHIYACGGDGTLNEVVSGIAGFDNAAVTHFPGGSGNDFIKIFDDPSAFRDLRRLLDWEEARFDLIECNGRYALNVCSAGLDARIGTQIADYKRLPFVTGAGSYILSALVNVIRGVSQPFVVEIGGETISGEQTMICAINGRCYGGSFYAVPDADPGDGLLDVLLVHKVSRLGVIRFIRKYQTGQYRSVPQLVRHIRTDALRIMCPEETSVNLDGELIHAKTIDIRLHPQKIRFFYPKELSYTPADKPAKSSPDL